jgi:hypothetical protein
MDRPLSVIRRRTALLARSGAVALALAMTGAVGLAACQGCRTPPPASAPGEPARPTVRLYAVSSMAGALEPCGCSKEQLGGIDHLAAYVAAQHAAAPDRLVVGAGPLLFMDPVLQPDTKTQDEWKAEAIALAARDVGLAAWAPGANDWADGTEALKKLEDESGATMLAGNLEGLPGITGAVVREVGGVKVGLVGVAEPKDRAGRLPDALRSKGAFEAMRAGIDEARRQGARVLVGLCALPRGEALRLADRLPELNVLVVGKPFEAGDGNDSHKAPTLAGSTLVVETSNHLQTVDVVDLYVRDGGDERITFADAGGVAKAEEILTLAGRIRDLEVRLANWEGDKSIKPEDLAARRADLERLRLQKAKLEAPSPAPRGSFFRYSVVEMRVELGSDPKVDERMLEYYKRVNHHNRVAFADRKPPPVERGKAAYIGVDACSECHEKARKVWDGTRHSHAYATLQDGHKEFNLDCVGCHVTGYGRPGGSTVTHVDKLRSVQCEACHGPGSLHAKEPKDKSLIVLKPSPDTCVSECHHPPHVEGFDAASKTQLILGPGHGQ